MSTKKTDVNVNINGDDRGLKATTASAIKTIGKFKADASKAFSGLGGEIFSLRGAVVGLFSGFSLKAIVDNSIEAEQSVAQLEAVLTSTKGAARLTKDELVAMAGGLQGLTTYGDEAIIGAQNLLLTFTNIGREVFPDALETVLDMSTAMKTDLKGAAIQLGKALNDPIKGVSALAEVGVNFNKQQQEQIKTLVQSGKRLEAQKIILRELSTEFGGSARAMRDTFGGAVTGLKNVVGDLLEGDSGSLKDATKSINDLAATLGSQEVKDGFAVITGAVIDLIGWLAKLAATTGPAIKAVSDAIKRNSDGRPLRQLTAEADALASQIERLQKGGGFLRLFGRDVDAEIDAKRKRLAELNKQIAAMRAAPASPAPAKPTAPASVPPPPVEAPVEDDAAKKKRAKGQASADAAIFAADQARAEAALEASYKARLITVEQYYARKLELEQAGIDNEIAARKKAMATADADERIQLQGEIDALNIRRVTAAEQNARELAAASLEAAKKRTEAVASAEASIFAAEYAKAEAELESSYAARLITVEQYYAAKLDLEQLAIDQEIATRQAALAEADADERVRINGEIEALRIRRVAAAQQSAREEVAAVKAERERLAQESLDQVQRQIDAVTGKFDRAQQAAADRVATGDISQKGAQGLVRGDAAAAVEQLRQYREQLAQISTTDAPGAADALNNVDDAIRRISIQAEGGLTRALRDLRVEFAAMQESFAGETVGALRDNLTSLFTALADGSGNAKQKLKDFVAGFAQSMAQIAARALATYATLQLLSAITGIPPQALGGGGAAAGVLHRGGIAGAGGARRQVPGFVFAGAPRYHQGGIAGLKPGEVPAVLKKGEEVLTQNDPRHVANAGRGGTRVINIIDPNLVQDYMTSSSGERVLVNLIERNAGAIKQVLG